MTKSRLTDVSRIALVAAVNVADKRPCLLLGLELLRIAIEKAGYTGRIQIGMDVAASEFCKEGPKYDLDFKNPQSDPAHWVSMLP